MDDKKIVILDNLLKRFNASGLQELEVESDQLRVRMCKPTLTTKPTIATNEQTTVETATIETIKSPMVGTIFLAASPESKPYITKGQKVAKGDTLCLIEAMKTFTPIVAEKSFVIDQVLVSNGQSVEFNQDLIAIED